MIVYRTMKIDDIPAGLSLCRSAGWNQLERDWQLFLRMSPEKCRVGVDESGEVVGTVATLQYQDHFTWIGMVLVNPERQGGGVGTQLLKEALALAHESETIKLDATPAGRELYLKLGFKDEYFIQRMHIGAHPVENLPKSLARPIQERDIPEILKLDRQVFGADRQSVLEWSRQGAPEYAFLTEDPGGIKGFCFGRHGYNFNHIGPVIATDSDIAQQLLFAALRHAEGKPTVIDVLNHSPGWNRIVSSLGFVVLRPLIRMYKGSNAHAGIPEKQFAILGPEFG